MARRGALARSAREVRKHKIVVGPETFSIEQGKLQSRAAARRLPVRVPCGGSCGRVGKIDEDDHVDRETVK